MNELYHHGILGMHWGQKNGPPYPLDAGDHSVSERQAGWRRSLGPSGPGDSISRRPVATSSANRKKSGAPNRNLEKKLLKSEKKKKVSSNKIDQNKVKSFLKTTGILALNAAILSKNYAETTATVQQGLSYTRRFIRNIGEDIRTKEGRQRLMLIGGGALALGTAAAIGTHLYKQHARKDPNSKVSIKERAEKRYQEERKRNIAAQNDRRSRRIESWGAGDKYTKAKYDKQMYTELAKASKTKLGKRINEQKAINAGYDMDYYSKYRNESSGKTFIKEHIADSSDFQRSYRRLSGRDTTVGEKYINDLTLGSYGIAKDIGYLMRKKKEQK